MPYFSSIAEAEEYSLKEREYAAMCKVLYDKFLCQDLGIRTHVQIRPQNKDYVFITVNPPHNLELHLFLKTIDKMCSKPWIDSYLYVMEQRGIPDVNVGYLPHTHVLLKMNKHVKQSIITRELKNTWRTKLDVENFALLNIKLIDHNEQIKIQDYMLSWKADESKHDKQYGDDIFRKQQQLPRFYTFNYKITSTLRSTYYD